MYIYMYRERDKCTNEVEKILFFFCISHIINIITVCEGRFKERKIDEEKKRGKE